MQIDLNASHADIRNRHEEIVIHDLPLLDTYFAFDDIVKKHESYRDALKEMKSYIAEISGGEWTTASLSEIDELRDWIANVWYTKKKERQNVSGDTPNSHGNTTSTHSPLPTNSLSDSTTVSAT